MPSNIMILAKKSRLEVDRGPDERAKDERVRAENMEKTACVQLSQRGHICHRRGEIIESQMIFHRNLCNIYCIAVVKYYPSMISRIAIIGFQIGLIGPGKLELLQYDWVAVVTSCVRVYYMCFVVGCLPLMVCERFAATIFAYDYEKKERIYISYILLSNVAASATLVTGLLVFRIITFMQGLLFGFILNCCSFVAFLVIIDLNIKAKRTLNKMDHNLYTLSRRYQIQENMMSIQIVLTMVVSCAIFNGIIAVFFIMAEASKKGSLAQNMLYELSDFSIAIYGVVIIIIGVSSNPPVKSEIMGIMKRRLNIRFSHKIDPETHSHSEHQHPSYVTARSGKRLYLGSTQEDYFKQLETSWKA